MILRLWVVGAGFVGAVACAGKSERAPSESSAADAAAGYGTSSSATGTGATSAASGGGGSSATGGASNAASSGASATGNDDLQNSPECLALSAGSIVDSCNRLATCAATLSDYLDLLRARGSLDDAGARIGCNLVEIGGLTFDQSGALVGYSISEDHDFGPCGAYEYVRGAGIDSSCIPARTCRIDPAATDAANLCSCPCPDPPPADGVVVVSGACFADMIVTELCAATSEEEHQTRANADYPWPHWENECGIEVAYMPGDIRCYYGDDGALLGIRHEDDTQCAGVEAWVTEGTPRVCTR